MNNNYSNKDYQNIVDGLLLKLKEVDTELNFVRKRHNRREIMASIAWNTLNKKETLLPDFTTGFKECLRLRSGGMFEEYSNEEIASGFSELLEAVMYSEAPNDEEIKKLIQDFSK